jgi:hypothetical protein
MKSSRKNDFIAMNAPKEAKMIHYQIEQLRNLDVDQFEPMRKESEALGSAPTSDKSVTHIMKLNERDSTGLTRLAEIVPEIDLGEGRYIVPEIVGIDAILRGWLQQNLSDEELRQRGLFLFDGLITTLGGFR